MNADSLMQLPKCNINFFKLKQKAMVSSGPCSVVRGAETLIFKTDVPKLQIPYKAIVARMTEVSYITYLYLHESGTVYTVSIARDDVLGESLYNVMKKEVEVIDFYQMPPDLELRQKINLECPLGQPGAEQMGATNDDKLNEIGEGIGNILGGISSVIDIDKVNKASNETVANISKTIFGQRVLSKWQIFKNKCAEINDKVAQTFKPVNQKCKEIASDIGKNFQSSDNSFIKNVREYSRKTETALNTGYQKGDAPRRASYMPNQQGRKPGDQPKKEQSKETPVGTNSSKIIEEERLNERKSLL